MEEEECKEEESDEDEEAVTLEEDAKRPWSFPRLAQEVFDAFEGRYDQLVEQLSRRIAASPEIAQLYMLRARLYTELGDPLNALRVCFHHLLGTQRNSLMYLRVSCRVPCVVLCVVCRITTRCGR
jgi:hypothetical protein